MNEFDAKSKITLISHYRKEKNGKEKNIFAVKVKVIDNNKRFINKIVKLSKKKHFLGIVNKRDMCFKIFIS
jgi:hypothetical protein